MVPALELRDLHFGYGRDPAVRAVSLSLQPGDCYGFLGHNGAGKTTVLRLALGLLTPRSGSVHVFGIDARTAPRAARARMGALIERPGFHLHASAAWNLRTLARLQGMPRRLATAACARVLELTGLRSVAHRRVGTYSMGMRQRLGVAQAMLGRPPLLLLDEPTNGLDPEGIAELRALLRLLTREEGVAVLVSSHQLGELDGLCNRIGVLREGALIVEGNLAGLRAQLRMRHIVEGTPLPALQRCLQAIGLEVEAMDDRLFVALDGRQPGAVVRALTAAGEVTAFAPEAATLETIYLRADRLRTVADEAVAAAAAIAAPAVGPPRPVWRALRHEIAVLLQQRSTALLVLLPAAVAIWRVIAHERAVAAGLERVQRGELFSAGMGSGQLAMAQALQGATPVFALGLLWAGSQCVAAELAGDTLRNTLVRAVTRADVLAGKMLAIAALAFFGWLVLVTAAALCAGIALGFGDLEELSRHGDRQMLAAAADVAPLLRQALLACMPPLLAVAVVGVAASVLARRPARALLLGLCLVLGPELLRERLREDAGWLLTSHLPTGLRDDSVLAWLEASARGAADALWRWESLSLLAPMCWIAAAVLIAAFLLRRLRVP